MLGSESTDLLIFRERGYSEPESKPPEAAPKGKQSPVAAQKRDLSETYCINHPWRKADQICEICKQPFCFADIMIHNGKYYCLRDIDYAANTEANKEEANSPNIFSRLSMVLLILNSVYLAYFTYDQIKFIASSTLNEGISFFINLNPVYYVPVANAAIIAMGIIAAISVSRKSIMFLGVSIVIVLLSLLAAVYEYMDSSVTYILVSSVVLFLVIALLAYSRMSSTSTSAAEQAVVQRIEWPKPEVF